MNTLVIDQVSKHFGGVVESLAGFYAPDGVKDVAAYVVVLLMLMVKPNGLFGEKLRKKV